MFYPSSLIFCFVVFLLHLIDGVVSLESEDIIGGLDVVGHSNNNAIIAIYSKDVGPHCACTGALITDSFALTAAHCFLNATTLQFLNKDYFIVPNTVNLTDHDISKRINISKVYIPKSYKLADRILVNDIAVMKLESRVGASRKTTPQITAILPEKNSNYENQEGVFFGYGNNKLIKVKNPETRSFTIYEGRDFLVKYMLVNIKGIENCPIQTIHKNIICGFTSQNYGMCITAVGDSGGPLFVGNTIVGVLSSRCNRRGKATPMNYYTNVTSFRDFIDKIILEQPDPDTTNTYLLPINQSA